MIKKIKSLPAMRNVCYRMCGPLKYILFWMKLNSNKWIFMGFYCWNIFQFVLVIVKGQGLPEFAHVVSKFMVKLRFSKLVRLCKVVTPYFVKFVGVKQFSWKFMVTFSCVSFLRISSGAWGFENILGIEYNCDREKLNIELIVAPHQQCIGWQVQ